MKTKQEIIKELTTQRKRVRAVRQYAIKCGDVVAEEKSKAIIRHISREVERIQPTRKSTVIPVDRFKEIWSESENVSEASAAMGITQSCAMTRASRLRAKGHKLKKFSTAAGRKSENLRRLKAYTPTPEEIKEKTEKIRKPWSEFDRRLRSGEKVFVELKTVSPEG